MGRMTPMQIASSTEIAESNSWNWGNLMKILTIVLTVVLAGQIFFIFLTPDSPELASRKAYFNAHLIPGIAPPVITGSSNFFKMAPRFQDIMDGDLITGVSTNSKNPEEWIQQTFSAPIKVLGVTISGMPQKNHWGVDFANGLSLQYFDEAKKEWTLILVTSGIVEDELSVFSFDPAVKASKFRLFRKSASADKNAVHIGVGEFHFTVERKPVPPQSLTSSSNFFPKASSLDDITKKGFDSGVATKNTLDIEYIQLTYTNHITANHLTIAGLPASKGWGAKMVNGATLQYSNDNRKWTKLLEIKGVEDEKYLEVPLGSTVTAAFWRLMKAKDYVAISHFELSRTGGGEEVVVSVDTTAAGGIAGPGGVAGPGGASSSK